MTRERTIPAGQLETFASRGELYALLDACDEPSVPQHCLNNPRAQPLYHGKSQEHHWHIAPYIAAVSAPELKWILEDLWKAPWGCFVVSGAGLQALHDHFRRFLQVKGPEGKVYLFRFYDPRVLRGFLKASSSQEITEFYGPVTMFGVAAQEGRQNVDMLWP
jgi:hypothetical protein